MFVCQQPLGMYLGQQHIGSRSPSFVCLLISISSHGPFHPFFLLMYMQGGEATYTSVSQHWPMLIQAQTCIFVKYITGSIVNAIQQMPYIATCNFVVYITLLLFLIYSLFCPIFCLYIVLFTPISIYPCGSTINWYALLILLCHNNCHALYR